MSGEASVLWAGGNCSTAICSAACVGLSLPQYLHPFCIYEAFRASWSGVYMWLHIPFHLFAGNMQASSSWPSLFFHLLWSEDTFLSSSLSRLKDLLSLTKVKVFTLLQKKFSCCWDWISRWEWSLLRASERATAKLCQPGLWTFC